jgi:hypothetical protein
MLTNERIIDIIDITVIPEDGSRTTPETSCMLNGHCLPSSDSGMTNAIAE